MKPRVAIVIVNWNGKADTLACLHSLREDRYPNKQIFVVDNGSADDSIPAMREEFPEVILLEAGANLGFTGGNNLGIAHALHVGADYVFLLNNDTICESDALPALVSAAQNNPRFGLLTPVIHYFDRPEEPWFAGSRLDLGRALAVHDNSRVPARDEAPFEIPWASGCAMLFPAELLQRLGGFDDRYFLNWEDVDLSLRARQFGYQIGLVPSASIRHKVGRSFRGIQPVGRYYYVRNWLLLLRLHAGAAWLPATARVLAGEARDLLRVIVRREPAAWTRFVMTLRALWDRVRGRYGPLVRTRSELTEAQRSACELCPATHRTSEELIAHRAQEGTAP